MRFGDHLVAVGRFADVVALLGVFHQPAPGLLQHVQHVPLGDGLFDPAGQDRGGPFAGQGSRRVGQIRRGDAFVGGQQCHTAVLQAGLDGGADLRDAGEPVDRFADHGHEPAGGLACLVEQVGDAAVAGYGNVELFVGVAVSALVQVEPAGLDVPEERHDHAVVR